MKKNKKDDNDRLLESTVNGVVTVYGYDDNGNLTSQTVNGETSTYVWDDRNRLVEALTADGDVISYEYNNENIRVSSSINGARNCWVYPDGDLGFGNIIPKNVNFVEWVVNSNSFFSYLNFMPKS
ncbi:MAG: RHS repeat domain-containing protein [Cyanobacteriota bacterium]|nr:RHS repeat domain-containing protein [Cyanobacteriota bacterium]